MLHVIYKDSVYEELVWMQAPSRSRSLSWCPRATNRWWWATRCSSTTRQWAATASWTPVSTRRLWACAVGYGPSRFWRAPRRRGSVHPPLKQVLERRQADSLAIIIVMGGGKAGDITIELKIVWRSSNFSFYNSGAKFLNDLLSLLQFPKQN